MNDLTTLVLASAGFGILGSILRIGVAATKIMQLKRKIRTHGIFFYAIVAIVSGAFAGIMLNYGWLGSFLAGYMALDLMEGFYNQFKKTKIKVQEE